MICILYIQINLISHQQLSRDRHVISMVDIQLTLDSHNQLCLTLSSVLGSTREPSQLLTLRSEVEEMLELVNEVRHYFLTF